MNNTTLDEIRKALDDATPGPWEWDRGGEEMYPSVFYNGIDERGRDYEMIAMEVMKRSNAHLIANAPTWLRSLLEELAAKDKVLGWYADEDKYCGLVEKLPVVRDGGARARSILSQYARSAPDPTESARAVEHD